MGRHICKLFDDELAELAARLKEMAQVIGQKAVCAVNAGAGPYRHDHTPRCCGNTHAAVVRLAPAIDDLAVRMLALRQPAGRDLRTIAMALKLTSELAACAAVVSEVARAGVRSDSAAPAEVPLESAVAMVERAVAAFTDDDAASARAILQEELELMDRAVERDPSGRWTRRVLTHAAQIATLALYASSSADATR